MTHIRLLTGTVVALLAACGSGSSGPIGNPPVDTVTTGGTPALARTVVLQNLSEPWDIAVAADGSIFFTERCRGLSVRRPDGSITRLFGTSGSSLVASSTMDLASAFRSRGRLRERSGMKASVAEPVKRPYIVCE